MVSKNSLTWQHVQGGLSPPRLLPPICRGAVPPVPSYQRSRHGAYRGSIDRFTHPTQGVNFEGATKAIKDRFVCFLLGETFFWIWDGCDGCDVILIVLVICLLLFFVGFLFGCLKKNRVGQFLGNLEWIDWTPLEAVPLDGSGAVELCRGFGRKNWTRTMASIGMFPWAKGNLAL